MMKTGRYSRVMGYAYAIINADAEIVIDLIDFKRIQEASYAVKRCPDFYPSLFSNLEEAVNSINTKLNTESSDTYAAGYYPNFRRCFCGMINVDAEIIIDLIDFKRIQEVLSAVDLYYDVWVPYFYGRLSMIGEAIIILREAVENINNSIKTKPINNMIDINSG